MRRTRGDGGQKEWMVDGEWCIVDGREERAGEKNVDGGFRRMGFGWTIWTGWTV